MNDFVKMKDSLYNEISEELTKYEQSDNTEEVNIGFLHTFYQLLVEVKNVFETEKENQ